MEAPKTTKHRMRHSNTFWRDHLNGWEQSGLSKTEYCRREGIAMPSLCKWYRKLKQEGTQPAGFVEIKPLVRTERFSGQIELYIPGVGILRIPEGASVESLRTVLAALKGIS
jgi:hypothetical protein